MATLGGGEGGGSHLHRLSEEGPLQHTLQVRDGGHGGPHLSPRVGDREGEVRQGRHSGETGGVPGQRHRRAGVHLHQRLPRHLQDLRLGQAGAKPADREVRQVWPALTGPNLVSHDLCFTDL